MSIAHGCVQQSTSSNHLRVHCPMQEAVEGAQTVMRR
jgi:hypothetical protein